MDPRYVRTDNQIRKVLKDIPWVGDLAGRALGATKAAVAGNGRAPYVLR